MCTDAPATKCDLIANVVHEGKANEGTYRAHIHRKVEETWYEVQDLRVIDVLPQSVALSEAYFQVWELKSGGAAAAAGAGAVAQQGQGQAAAAAAGRPAG
jgi:U4/U6.U5 tri-snRNP-associated protein 2